jgi:hypothetical protein
MTGHLGDRWQPVIKRVRCAFQNQRQGIFNRRRISEKKFHVEF